ncbi:aspartyl-tRNA(Asn)/glutamyl-tRNA(Gln) amidotransferase subunit A [Paraburkholderia tropica]|uniref:amidase family protein n=1 Tax=Paraburkholderia tropica TaxID=92647 RepID=UPI0017B955D6|nr:amidase family protein [Paraburkholderia tropica]MBB2999076.1 aspartyl-tRNA(Asn)/glutamyl-tRNA(Gln) amidotransferase subunit A [Paraburkholderia tropica]MBB6319024.1 aspartyl-tRNA(Asn)/glutamyl-tRNA(Gln) amidotransferase subunit A [Paraburkholderia tropica]
MTEQDRPAAGSTSNITARAIAAAYKAGVTDPVEVASEALARASRAGAAFISVDEAGALGAARASAARWRAGAPLSAFDGVPLAWKDLFDVAGSVTTAGAQIYRERAAATVDAPLVAAARRGGAIAIGKTNLSELAYSGLGLNPHFGTPVNPALDGEQGARAPGGSSSGSAVAVATGVVPLAMGTDTAGSIRVPAAFNGLTGYRASTARYPGEGVTGLSQTCDTSGPLAHDVTDCIDFDALLRGAARVAPLPDVRGQRFIYDERSLARFGVSDAVARNLDTFVARLARAGATIDTRTPASFLAACDVIRELGWIGSLEAFARYRSLLDSPDAVRLDARVRTRLEASRNVSATRLAELHARRADLLAAFAQELGDATLVLPSVPHVAPALAPLERDADLFARVNLATLALTMPGSFLDTPAVALPSGRDDAGLPTGAQLLRAQNDDDRLLAVAEAAQAVFSSQH